MDDEIFLGALDLEKLTKTKASHLALLGQHRRAGHASFKLGRRRVWQKSAVLAWLAEQEAAIRQVAVPRARLSDEPSLASSAIRVVRAMRSRSFTHLAASSRESVEEAVLSAAYGTLCIDAGLSPGSNPWVALKLHQSALLEKASIDHREYRNCRIDFAWPVKRVGLRVNTWPR